MFLVACAVLLSTARGEVPTDVYLLIGQSNMAARAKEIPNMKVVSSEGLVHKGDKLHFDTPSLRTLGLRYAEAMRELQGSKR